MSNWTRPKIRRLGIGQNGNQYKLLCIFGPDAEIESARLAYEFSDQINSTDGIVESIPPYTKAVFTMNDLPSNTKVSYAVAGSQNSESLPDAQRLSQESRYSFSTFPEKGPKTVGLATCNGIEEVPEGKGTDVWQDLFEERIGHRKQDLDCFILAGDQIYADSIKKDYKRGELTCDELTEAFRRRYFNVLKRPAIQNVLARVPSVMMWDDHDIYNGYGSHDIDDGESQRVRENVFNAAEKTFHEFQASVNPRPSDPFDMSTSKAFSFETDRVAVVCPDGRTNRNFKKGNILGARQLEQLETKIEALTDENQGDVTPDHLFIVLGIPLLFVRKWIGEFSEELDMLADSAFETDIRDGWRWKQNKQECEELLRMLFEYNDDDSAPKISVLSGDVHVGTIGYLIDQESDQMIPHVTSSAIGYHPPRMLMGLAPKVLEGLSDEDFSLSEERDIVGRFKPFAKNEDFFPRSEILPYRNYASIDTTTDWDDDLEIDYRFEVYLYRGDKPKLQKKFDQGTRIDSPEEADTFDGDPIKDGMAELKENL